MKENEPMKLKLPESELKSVDQETMNNVRHISDDEIRTMLPDDEPPEELPKKRGRKPKAVIEQEQAQQVQELIDDLKPVIAQGLNFIANRMPYKFPPSDLEVTAITKSFDLVARKHFGKLAEHAPEIALAGSLGFFLLGRIPLPFGAKESRNSEHIEFDTHAA